jgi:tetratricopeptide (TPR) repeat protein
MNNTFKNVVAYCDKIILVLLITAVIVPQLFFDIRLYSVFDLSKATALYLIVIAILIVWSIILAFKQNFRFSRTPLDISILAFIFVFVISTVISINPIVSLFGTYKRYEGLTPTVCYILVFYAIVNFINTKKRLYLLIISIVAGAVIASCYGILQHLGFDLFKWSSFEARRVFSTFGNPVFFAAYLVMTLPPAVALFFSYSNKEASAIKNRKILSWIFFVLFLIVYSAFWLTNTRACFVALIGGLIPLLILIYVNQDTKKYRFIIWVASFIALGIFFNVRPETSVINRFRGDFDTTMNISTDLSDIKVNTSLPVTGSQTCEKPWIATKLNFDGSTFSRVFQYLAATKIFKDYPLFGIGPDTIGIVYQKYLAKVFTLKEGDPGFLFPRQDRIHNDILDTVVTRGIFGLGTYIWLLVALGIFVCKSYRQLNNRNKMLMVGLLAGIISYLIQNEFSFGNTPIVTLFWVMMGLCISIVKINNLKLVSEELTANQVLINNNINRAKPFNTSSREKINKLHRGTEEKDTFPDKTGSRILTRFNVFKWIGCASVPLAMGFVLVFVLRFYMADAYFEYGRRIMEYEKANLENVTEKGLFFIKHGIRLNPYEIFYRDELCRTYIQMAYKAKDETLVQKAFIEANNTLRLIPQHFMGFFHLGMIYQMLSEVFSRNTLDSAITCYEKAIDSDPFQSPFHFNLGIVYITKGDLGKAIYALYQAYLIQPEDVNCVDRLANVYLQKESFDNALYFAKKTVKLNPSEPGYYNNLGAILGRKGMYEESIIAFKKAIELNPNEPIYLDNLTKMYLSIGKYDELISFYEKQLATNPSVDGYHNNLGAIYKMNRRFEDAIKYFKQAVELKPENPVYTYNLATAYVELGKHNDAKMTLQMFNKTYSNHDYININLLLADFYLKNADWSKVISECEQALRIDKNSIIAYKFLGTAYYSMNNYELAEKALSTALTLDANDQEAKDLLAKIQNKTKKDI